MTNPLTLLKLYRKVNALIGLLQRATASYERSQDMSKSLFASKIFWVNLLSATAEILQLVSGMHVAPPGTIAVASNVVNIALRTITTQPVHVTAPK